MVTSRPFQVNASRARSWTRNVRTAKKIASETAAAIAARIMN
jgi:hypothetical protein